MKNIQQVAEELNVSKTTIRNYLKKLPQNLSLKKDKNTYLIDDNVENFLKETVSSNDNKKFKKDDFDLKNDDMKIQELNQRIEEIKKDNEHLKKDINKKDNWIEDLNILLKQQQQLQLDANKELMKYKKDV